MAKKKKVKRKIALVGTAPSSIHAPIDDPSWEVWGVGFRGDHITRCTRWFEIHRLDGLRDGPEWRPLLKTWAKDCELVMFWPEPLGPNIFQYPVDDVKTRFGSYFMTSSFAWMVALALHEHLNGQVVDEIGIWGVDMEYGTEYREQRAGLRHFLGLARFAGIPTTLLVNGGVVYEPVPYPFWCDDPLLEKLDHRRRGVADEHETRSAALDASNARLSQIDAATKELVAYCGHSDLERIAELRREADALSRTLPRIKHDIAFCKGVMDEIDWQKDYLKP